MTIRTESASEGQAKILSEPIKIRFKFSRDDATALDTASGLMWAKNAYFGGKDMNWFTAMSLVRGLDIGGYRDWRLPNKAELEQFAKSAGNEKPFEYFTANGFNNVQADCYWSGTEKSSNSYTAWEVSMKDSIVHDFGKGSVIYVWPVRLAK